ncbi:hypothetical protein, partial [Stenotrophomonas maltophilia]|uniref:hypothetical protein n=1 Tax=Stenotrophomonas maltophilia TaxID=40324 RepID=UPI001EF910E0
PSPRYRARPAHRHRLACDHVKPVAGNEGLGVQARVRLHTRHVALRCQPEDVAHELLPDALSRMVAGYEEVIDLS